MIVTAQSSAVLLPAEPLGERTAAPGAGAPAVEVAAMLGDSVIGVKHCMDPRSGTPAATTWVLLAAGAACLVASAIAFLASLHDVADNRAALARWTRSHRPAHAFRPHQLPVAVDWIAFASAALGALGVGVGLVRLGRERTTPYYRIGTAPGVELAIADAPSPAFPLIAPSGDGFVFNHGAGIDGEMIVDGKPIPLGELGAGRARPSTVIAGAIEVAIPPGTRIRARAGRASFAISVVTRPRRHAVPLFAMLDQRALAYIAGSLAVHLAAWGLLQAIPPEASGVDVALDTLEHPGMHAAGAVRIEPPPERGRGGEDGGDDGARSDAAAMALPSGATGNPAATHDGRLQVARLDDHPRLSRPDAIAQAIRDSMLGSEQLRSAVGALAATSDLSSGFDVTSSNGAIYGASGEAWGSFGGGIAGLDIGAGCTAEPCGTIGVHGRYDTIHTGAHAGDGFRFPRGNGVGLPGHTARAPRIGEPTTTGSGYDKTIVRRYIRRHVDEIAYCYDKQLLARPGIEGEVEVAFVISPTGVVQSASGTGFDAAVSSCVASVIRQIAFPAPGDGGVQVHYPFHFHAS